MLRLVILSIQEPSQRVSHFLLLRVDTVVPYKIDRVLENYLSLWRNGFIRLQLKRVIMMLGLPKLSLSLDSTNEPGLATGRVGADCGATSLASLIASNWVRKGTHSSSTPYFRSPGAECDHA